MIESHPEQQYLNIGSEILEEGVYKPNRTGVGTYSLFGRQMRFNLQEGFPLLTTKYVPFRPMVAELLWFLKGSTDNNLLREMGAKIWDQWATEDGDLGPIYGKQWVNWEVPQTDNIEAALEELMEDNQSSSTLSPEDLHYRLDEILMMVRNPRNINQIQDLVDTLKQNPNSRRMLVTAWNPADLPQEREYEFRVFDAKNGKEAEKNGWEYYGKESGIGPDADGDVYRKLMKLSPQDNVRRGKAALPACHTMFQFYTRPLSFEERVLLARKDKGFVIGEDPQGGTENAEKVLDTLNVPRHGLSCQLYQRSADWPIGVPFNIVSYALLTEMIAQVTGMLADEFIWTGGDVHIYEDQMELFQEQLDREPYPFPKLLVNDQVNDIFDFVSEDFTIVGYEHHPKIKYPVAT